MEITAQQAERAEMVESLDAKLRGAGIGTADASADSLLARLKDKPRSWRGRASNRSRGVGGAGATTPGSERWLGSHRML
ncbi:MAG: hypothetical protein BFD77_05685 [Pseudomonas sp. CO183]|nr:MAG: hypothetical protein BFD77_05685 [Pseudomonas sp. CO183]